MRILGIDPGYAIIGCGTVAYDGHGFKALDYRAITTEAGTAFPQRLLKIEDDLLALLDLAKPDAVAIEKLYFNTNTTTAIDVAQARGVIVASCARRGIPIYEYTPLQVKLAVVGYGRAEKHQVMEMTRIMLGLAKVPRPDDVADALAMAICCAHSDGAAIARRLMRKTGEAAQ